MNIGSLGDVVFEVSDDSILTITGVSRSGNAKTASHERHRNVSMLEWTGYEAESLSININLVQYLTDRSIVAVRDTLIDYCRQGTPVTFVLGSERYGRYKWLITGWSEQSEYFDVIGNVQQLSMALTLTEYARS